MQDQLSVLEFTDSRTGLSTHRAFDEALEREWNRTLREGSEISLLLLDFNHFRQFHDWRQHREGDRCLGEAAAAVIGALRITDFAARYGAEDIAIILPSTDSGGAAKVAEKVQSAAQALRSACCWKWDERRPADGEYGRRDGVGASRRNRENARTSASRSRQCTAKSQARQNQKAICRCVRSWGRRALRVNLDPVISHLRPDNLPRCFRNDGVRRFHRHVAVDAIVRNLLAPWFLTCHSFLPGDRSGSDRNTQPPRAPADGRRGRSSSSCSAKISNSGFSAAGLPGFHERLDGPRSCLRWDAGSYPMTSPAHTRMPGPALRFGYRCGTARIDQPAGPA